jgi:lipoprotein-anchoring transpeptidase ErfK/SrfK
MIRLSTVVAAVAGCFAILLSTHANAFEIDPLTRRPLVKEEPAPVFDSGTGHNRSYRSWVSAPGNYPTGTIVISTQQRYLYLMTGGGKALRYGVGVGRPGFTWGGNVRVTAKREWPDWTPPAAMRKRQPGIPAHMKGGIENPLGARALYLGSTIYRIHGSNEPETIGSAVSSGCFRMTNTDVIDLYKRVPVGTPVIILR